MDSSVSGNSSPVSYTSKDDSTNNQSNGSNGSNGNNSMNASTAATSNTPSSVTGLGPIGSKPATPSPMTASSSGISPWGNTQQQPQSATRKASSNVVGSERGNNTAAGSTTPITSATSSSIFGNVGSNGTGDWFPPLKSAPGFERSRIGQYQQQSSNINSSNASSDALSSQIQQHVNIQAHPGMQARSVSTSGIASIGSGRRQVSEANSVRSSRPASPSLSIVTSPSIGTSPQSFNPMGNLSLSSTLQSSNSSFGTQDQSIASLAASGGGGIGSGGVNANHGNNAGPASTTSDLESAFDSMLRASPAFQDIVNRITRLETQVQQLGSYQNLKQHDASSAANLPQHVNGHFDATPTRSPSVAGSVTSSYLTAPAAAGLPNRPHSLLIPNHAPSPASIAGSLHSPGLPPHAATEPSTPIYGTPNAMSSTTERDAIRQLTVQLSALGNNVAQLMAQSQGPQTPSAGPPGPAPYDMPPHTPHGGHHPPHPAAMHAPHHHPGAGRPNMQNLRSGSFDVPRGAVIPRGGPVGPYGDDREPRGKRSHLTLQAPTPVGMGSRRHSADVIENMHAAAEGMPGGAGGPAGSALGSQSLLGKWEALGISGDMLRAIVKYGIGPPSKIQMKAIPCVLNTQDIVAQASSIQERIQCYVIPTLQVVYNSLQQGVMNEASESPYRGVHAVVLTATIDQAGQAQRMCLGLGQALGITSSLVVGQGDASQEAASFANNPPHILVGTPQKLLDLLSLRMIPVDKLVLLVIDEMDQLIARNLSDYVNNLAKLLPPPMSNAANSRDRSPAPGGPGSGFKPFEGVGRPHERQTAIFSCTVPQEVLNFASALNLREPVRVLVRRENNQGGGGSGGLGSGNNSNTSSDTPAPVTPNLRGVKHWFLYLAMGNGHLPGRGPNGRQESASTREWKLEALADLCADAEFTQAVVYCSSIDSVEAVAYKLSSRNIDALALHGDMGAPARHAILSKFRSGNTAQGRGVSSHKRVLVVYDALCRTLTDIHQVAMCINYDLPRAVEDYIHRVSCAASTGYGRAGSSVNIVSSSSDIEMLRSIESFYRLKINELPPNLTNTF